MDWIQAEIATNTDGIDILCGKLQMAGINGFEIEDAAEFEEFLHHSGPHWDMVDEELLAKKTGSTCVKLYLSDPEQLAAVRAALAELRRDGDPRELGTLELRVTSVDEQDWANAWKKYYKPLRAGAALLSARFGRNTSRSRVTAWLRSIPAWRSAPAHMRPPPCACRSWRIL